MDVESLNLCVDTDYEEEEEVFRPDFIFITADDLYYLDDTDDFVYDEV